MYVLIDHLEKRNQRRTDGVESGTSIDFRARILESVDVSELRHSDFEKPGMISTTQSNTPATKGVMAGTEISRAADATEAIYFSAVNTDTNGSLPYRSWSLQSAAVLHRSTLS